MKFLQLNPNRNDSIPYTEVSKTHRIMLANPQVTKIMLRTCLRWRPGKWVPNSNREDQKKRLPPFGK